MLPSITMKTYINRLYNAILGREYQEPRYLWSLDYYILELVVNFIQSDRCWYPVGYTEEQWENKLNRLLNAILERNKLDEDWTLIEKDRNKYIADMQKNERIIKKELSDVLLYLWN